MSVADGNNAQAWSSSHAAIGRRETGLDESPTKRGMECATAKGTETDIGWRCWRTLSILRANQKHIRALAAWRKALT